MPVSLRVINASLSPATSRMNAAWYRMFSGADRPRATGLEPMAPKSSSTATKAVLMSAPESNFVHWIV
jgi:hypothetical protein